MAWGWPHAWSDGAVDSPLMETFEFFKTALPVLIVAVVTQLTLVVRSGLENRKTRRFLRADLATEAREGLRGLDIFLASCNAANVTDVNQLGPGLAIAIAPIQCKEEYVRLSAAVKEALPTLSKQEFQVASALKGAFRLIIGYTEACNNYFLILQNATISPGFSEEGVELRRQIFRDFGVVAKQQIHVNADKARAMASLLLKDMDDQELEALEEALEGTSNNQQSASALRA